MQCVLLITDFSKIIPFTITNTCNLRYRICIQWSEEEYIHGKKASHFREYRYKRPL